MSRIADLASDLERLLKIIQEVQFIQIISEVFQSKGDTVTSELPFGKHRVDLEITKASGDRVYLEIVSSRIYRPSLFDRITRIQGVVGSPLIVLFNSVITSKMRQEIEARTNVTVWDLTDLILFAGEARMREILARYSSLLESESRVISASLLLDRLTSLSPGTADALSFQEWVKDILSYLFVPPLGLPFWESRDEAGRNRRDLIFPNSTHEGYWRVLSMDYRAPYVTVDAKNHKDPIGKEAILQMSHYLKPYGLGLFGIIVSRNGLSEAGRHAQREHWIGQSKMIVSLTVENIGDMAELKDKGGTPESIIEGLITDFRLSL